MARAGGTLYLGVGGHVVAIDAAAGNVLWHNALKGLGRGIVAFPGSGLEAAAAVAAAQAAAAASY